MPDYTVKDTQTGKTITFRWSGEQPPTDADMEQVFSEARQSSAPQTQAPTEQSYGVGDAALDAVRGVGAGLASTMFHGGDLIRRGLGMERVINNPDAQAAMTAPPSIAGTVGKAAEQIGEFFLPSGEIAAGAKALNTGSKLVNLGTRAALEGAAATGVSTLQTGSPEEGLRTGAITAGTTAALSPVAKLLKPLGEKIESGLVKASRADYTDGFKVGNIFKYKVGGTLDQSFEKVQNKIGDLSKQLKTVVTNSPREADVAGAFQRARARLGSNPARTFGTNAQIDAAFNKLESEPFFQSIVKAGGKADIATAQDMKLAMGDMGAWLHDPSGKTIVDPDSKALEKVANTVYDELKLEIERKAWGPVKDINRQMSDLIPIRRALIRRIPVAARSNVFNMGDLLSFANGGWKLSLANRIAQSGRTAQLLVGASPMVEAAAPATARTVGALTEEQ